MENASQGPRLQKETLDRSDASAQGRQKLRKTFIGSIDQGTSSSRFLIFNGLGQPVAQHQMGFSQLYPHPGWVPSGRLNVSQDKDR